MNEIKLNNIHDDDHDSHFYSDTKSVQGKTERASGEGVVEWPETTGL